MTRYVYVISYESRYNKDQRIYLQTSPKRRGVVDINNAHHYTCLTNALKEMQSIKLGNPRVEKHELCIAALPLEIIDA